MSTSGIRATLTANLARLISERTRIDRALIERALVAPPRGLPPPELAEAFGAIADVAVSCRADLGGKGARAWLRRLTRSGGVTFASLADLCRGLEVEVGDLFARVVQPDMGGTP